MTIPFNALQWQVDEMAELLLDPDIRMWVILPIVLITLTFGLVRHYATILLGSDKTPTKQQVMDA